MLRQRGILCLGTSLAAHAAALYFIHASLPDVALEFPEVAENEQVEPDLIDIFREDDIRGERVFPDEKPSDEIIVRTEKADNQERPEKSRFLGKEDQTVESQTKASRVGEFHAAPENGETTKPPESADRVRLPTLESIDKLSLRDLGIIPSNSRAYFEAMLEGDLAFDSATNDHLPDVAVGNRTLLSAKEYAHWGYMQRIRKRVGPRWSYRVQQTITAMAAFSKDITEGKKTTRVIVELDRDGVIEDVSIVQASGSRSLDEVAVKAFREERSFPNPPDALVRPDGTVRVRWTFSVTVVKPTTSIASSTPQRERRFD